MAGVRRGTATFKFHDGRDNLFATAPSLAATHPHADGTALGDAVIDRINAIRVSFGLPPGQPTTDYNSKAIQGVRSNDDPPFAPEAGGVIEEYSLWGFIPDSSAASYPSPLEVVNSWVYHDGWRGSAQATWNLDCTSVGAPGCNGHRRAVLSPPPAPGARLFIDATVRNVKFSGSSGLAVAVLMVWKS
jgi:hypothetical protein